ncbi:hypothetical protein [Dyella ginsengisoli]|uniref:hypothetical protein n=1 Tax=Dyella ginsengisoli TaxID=363848 RepID=UPI000349AA7C|nr:hypothetical protein [Dyella ginsengisoli]
MKRLLPTLAVLWLMHAAPIHAACVPVKVHYDAKTQVVEAAVTLPRGVDTLALRDLASYHRTKLWTSPDGSARIGETTLTAAAPGQRTLHLRMDVHGAAPLEDRAYAPWLRFTDGTVAVYAPLFLAASDSRIELCPRWVPSSGQQVIGYGRAQPTPLATDMAAPEGYVAFGRPLVLRHGALMLVSDHGTPAWVRGRIAREAPALVDRYTQSMGPARVPMLFVFNRPLPRGARDFRGDHLPASITLGLFGDGWSQVAPDSADQLTRFLAHELFHSWDSGPALGSPEGEALLAKEGGADLAKIFAGGAVLGQSRQAIWDAVARSYDSCLLQLPHDISVARALERPQPGAMPYACGAALMSALAVAADPADPAHGYFGLWRALRQSRARHPRDGYRWQDLMPPSLAPSVRRLLEQAVAEPGAFAPKLEQAWSSLGVKVQPVTTLDADTRRTYLGKVMMHLMAADCGGTVSFWNDPDGFRLDQPLPRCHALHAGARVISILGEPLASADPLALARRVRARCIAGKPVPVGYAAEHGQPAPADSPLHCGTPLPMPPVPVRLVAPSG